MWQISIALILLGFILAILFLQRFINENQKDINKIIHLDNKDYFYIVLIVSILFILWISADLYHREEIIDFISFAGTVTSIILGVIAIIYSMIQSATSVTSQKALDDSAMELNGIVLELKEQITVSNKVTNDLETNYTNLLKKIEVLDKKLDESIVRLDRVEKQTKKYIIISPFEFNFDESDDTEWE